MNSNASSSDYSGWDTDFDDYPQEEEDYKTQEQQKQEQQSLPKPAQKPFKPPPKPLKPTKKPLKPPTKPIETPQQHDQQTPLNPTTKQPIETQDSVNKYFEYGVTPDNQNIYGNIGQPGTNLDTNDVDEARPVNQNYQHLKSMRRHKEANIYATLTETV